MPCATIGLLIFPVHFLQFAVCDLNHQLLGHFKMLLILFVYFKLAGQHSLELATSVPR